MGSNTSTNIQNETILFVSSISYLLKEGIKWLEQIRNVSDKIILELETNDEQPQTNLGTKKLDENIIKEKEFKEELKWLEQIRSVATNVILKLKDLPYSSHDDDETIVKEKEFKEELEWLEQIRSVAVNVILKLEDLDPHPHDDNEDEIDITNYRIVKFGERRYAILRDADMNTDVNIYEISNYVGPKDFKIVSINPIGKFNNKIKKVKLNK